MRSSARRVETFQPRQFQPPARHRERRESCKQLAHLEEFEAQCEKGVKMSFQLQIEETPCYLAARFTGTGTLEEPWRQFELIAENSKRANKNKLLLDFTEAHAKIPLADRYFFVKEMRIFARYKVVKVAVVGRSEQLDYKKFGELVAMNQGVNGRVFTNVEDAEEWLLE
jgi:hypothetical protein